MEQLFCREEGVLQGPVHSWIRAMPGIVRGASPVFASLNPNSGGCVYTEAEHSLAIKKPSSAGEVLLVLPVENEVIITLSGF